MVGTSGPDAGEHDENQSETLSQTRSQTDDNRGQDEETTRRGEPKRRHMHPIKPMDGDGEFVKACSTNLDRRNDQAIGRRTDDDDNLGLERPDTGVIDLAARNKAKLIDVCDLDGGTVSEEEVPDTGIVDLVQRNKAKLVDVCDLDEGNIIVEEQSRNKAHLKMARNDACYGAI